MSVEIAGLPLPDPEEIEEDLQEILEELGYVTPVRETVTPPVDVLSPALEKVLIVIFVMIALAIFLYLVFQTVNRSVISVGEPGSGKKREEELMEIMIEKKDYSAFYRKAVDLGKKGEYCGAVRTLYMALLVLLDAKKVITYHPSLTNFEYRQTVNPYPFGILFENVTRTFDIIFYGSQKATGTDFSQVMDAFTQIEEAVS